MELGKRDITLTVIKGTACVTDREVGGTPTM